VEQHAGRRVVRAGRPRRIAEGAEVWLAQVRRMIADPKSASLVENFAGQWLNLRNLEEVTPDPEQFPGFDADLKHAMRRETELLFDAVMREDPPHLRSS
jgi:hypothetical protein